MIDGVAQPKCPLPPGLALHGGTRLIAGDHLLARTFCRDPLGRRCNCLADAGEHVGDSALRDREAEEALADFSQPLEADHLAACR